MLAFFSSVKQYLTGILGVFLLITCVVATIALLRTPIFEAEARITIPEGQQESAKKGRSELLDKPRFSPSSSASAPQGASLQTAVEMLQGNVLAEQVITAIGATKLFPDLEQNTRGDKDFLAHTLASFQQQLTITQIKETRIIKIAFQHQEPELSAQVVEMLIRFFDKEYRKFLPPKESLYNEQLIFAHQKMYQTAQALSQFKQQNKLLLVGETPDKLTEQYDMLKTLLASKQENLEKQLQQLTKLENQFADSLKSDPHGKEQKKQEELNGPGKDLIRLKLYEQELRKKYGEGSSGDRLIANVGLQIASLEKLLYAKADIPEAEQKNLDETAEQIVTARMAYHNQQKKTDLLQRQIRQVENKLQRATEQNQVLGKLQQQAETSRKRYASLADKFERFEKIQIIERPIVPLAPIKPKQKTALLAALISGLIGSILYGIIQLLRNSASSS